MSYIADDRVQQTDILLPRDHLALGKLYERSITFYEICCCSLNSLKTTILLANVNI